MDRVDFTLQLIWHDKNMEIFFFFFFTEHAFFLSIRKEHWSPKLKFKSSHKHNSFFQEMHSSATSL